MKKGNNKGFIVGIIVAIITFGLIQVIFLRTPEFSEVMIDAATDINKDCPIMIDGDTRLDKTIALPNNEFQYNYTLVNVDKAEIDVSEAEKFLDSVLLISLKTNPELETFRHHKTKMSYQYKDKNDEFLFKFSFDAEEYQLKLEN